MSLISQPVRHVERETFDKLKNAPHDQRKDEERDQDKYNGLEEFDASGEDESVDSDMEGSLLDQPRITNSVQVPALPQRSERRTSKVLEKVMMELKEIESIKPREERASIIQGSDLPESYLSSEEEVSLSDDYEDSLLDFDDMASNDAEESMSSSSRASSRKSQEDTARVVSFILVGKPQIVNIYLPSAKTSPNHSQNRLSMHLSTYMPTGLDPSALSERSTQRRPSPLKLYQSARSMSVASAMSSPGSPSNTSSIPSNASTTSITLPPIPQRISSRLSTMDLTPPSPSAASHLFLNSDPFASPSKETSIMEQSVAGDVTHTQKTPISFAAAAAWTKGISKSLAKARKPSMPKLSLAYTPGVVTPRGRAQNPEAFTPSEERKSDEAAVPPEEINDMGTVTPTRTNDEPTKYGGMIKHITRSPQPDQSPARKGFGLSLGRRKSIKGR